MMLTFQALALCRGNDLTNMRRASVPLYLCSYINKHVSNVQCTVYFYFVIFKAVIQICKVIWNKWALMYCSRVNIKEWLSFSCGPLHPYWQNRPHGLLGEWTVNSTLLGKVCEWALCFCCFYQVLYIPECRALGIEFHHLSSLIFTVTGTYFFSLQYGGLKFVSPRNGLHTGFGCV